VNRFPALERRVPLLFALLALCVLGLLAMSWKAYDDLQQAQRERDHADAVLAGLAELERATAPQSALLLCAVSGASRIEVPRPPDPLPFLERLRRLLADDAAQLGVLAELPPLLAALQRSYLEPLDQACREGRRLTDALALDYSALGVAHRSRIHGHIDELRRTERRRLFDGQARLQARSDDAGQLFALFAVATAVLAVVATIGMRGVTTRLAVANRRLRREATDRSMAQEQQRESQRRLEMVLDHIPDAVIAFDADARVQWINPAGEAMFGRFAVGLRAQPMALLVPELDHWLHWPDTQPEIDPEVVLPESWTARRETLYGLRADGSEFPIEIALVQTRVNGERVGVCVCRDLTELERVERMKHEFVSMVSHELRTPLTSIRGSLSMLSGGMAGELSAPVQRLVGLAHDNSERLVALVNDILDFEKLRAGEVRMDLQPVDLRDEVRAAVEACEGYAREHRVAVEIQAGDAAVTVQADPLRLGQVLANLLSNAIKFSPQGGEVQVVVSRHEGEGRIWVIDSGPGVPPGFVDRLFEPFAQADDLQTRKRGGTGLGLAISRAMAEQMGGHIGVEPPRPGQGSVFWVSLPPPAAAPAAPAAVPA
jgi:NtrC-family two-component system sensor histidine kinase KinB